jgi:hypothetical protein
MVCGEGIERRLEERSIKPEGTGLGEEQWMGHFARLNNCRL